MDRRLQFIFSGFALVMLILLGWRAWTGAWTGLHWAMLGVAALCCSLVFVRFVFIFTYSYALSALLNGALIALWLQSPAAWLLGGIMCLYGLRLFAFIWSRDHSASYAPRVDAVKQADAGMPAPAKISLLVMCSLLLCFQVMAIAFAGSQTAFAGAMSTPSPGVLVGAAIMFAGTVIEGLADWQKQAAKRDDAGQLVTTGLYRRWRHPNYAGEILLQLGLIIAGLWSVSTLGDALVVVIAPSYIVILMVAEAFRVDKEQELKYGTGDEYKAWRGASGSLVPRF
jgi:steroid 5-alpha reductase family enzyme